MKQSALKLLARAGAFAPFRAANRGRVLILTYHRFSRGRDPLATLEELGLHRFVDLHIEAPALSLAELRRLRRAPQIPEGALHARPALARRRALRRGDGASRARRVRDD